MILTTAHLMSSELENSCSSVAEEDFKERGVLGDVSPVGSVQIPR